ncbi:MAG: large subunit ribosomal protein L25 [Pirellulaceae bacterium]|jgi:large subunit ribosomal protein L25
MADVLNCSLRETLGTSNTRRLRRSGNVPAILYGHGKDNVCLTVPTEEFVNAINHGAKLVDLTGAVSESALISVVQWDAFGAEIMHVDLTRVDRDERVETIVAIELRGISPGTKEGGILKHLLHEISVDCPVISIPEKLVLNINTLGKEEALTVADLKLPEGAKFLIDVTTIVATCTEPEEEAEGDEGAGAMNEPEVIGRKADDEEAGG